MTEFVAVAIGVLVGVIVGVLLDVKIKVAVLMAMAVAVFVAMFVDVTVTIGVEVAVNVEVIVDIAVGVEYTGDVGERILLLHPTIEAIESDAINRIPPTNFFTKTPKTRLIKSPPLPMKTGNELKQGTQRSKSARQEFSYLS
jgi:hypothetical protein